MGHYKLGSVKRWFRINVHLSRWINRIKRQTKKAWWSSRQICINMNYFIQNFSSNEIKYTLQLFTVRLPNMILSLLLPFSIKVVEKYISLQTERCAQKNVQYCRSRFQIEFLYRDAKQHCGLTNIKLVIEINLIFISMLHWPLSI